MKRIISIGFLSLILWIGNAYGFAETKEVEIQTSAVCGMCRENIEKEFTFTKGIKSFTLDQTNGKVTVQYNSEKTDPDKIRLAISRAGYDADTVKANPGSYEKLDACCKKDQGRH